MIYTELAQGTIDKIISILVEGGPSELDKAIHEALLSLVIGFNIDQGLLWLIVADRLTVIGQHSKQNGSGALKGLSLDAQQSTSLVLNFLSVGNVAVDVTKASSDWAALLSVSQDFDSQLVAPLRARGIFPGFLSLQSRNERQWSVDERSTLEKVAALLAVVVSYDFDLRRIEQSAK